MESNGQGSVRRYRAAAVLSLSTLASMLTACSHPSLDTRAAPAVRVDLGAYGLPRGFFAPGADKSCNNQIILYRFVSWLSEDRVAVGFNTSPNCRGVAGRKVDGSARLLIFDLRGGLKAQRDIPYLADGNGELVAEGEAGRGPQGTLLFRIESVNLDERGANESKSGVLLLDADLQDVVRLDRFLEQTTFVTHALVFQDGFTLHGPRDYLIVNSTRPTKELHRREAWPTGTMGRKFGEYGVAYALCQQEVKPGTYVSTDVVYAGARRQCTLTVETEDGRGWATPLSPNSTASIIGFLTDGDIAGQVNSPEIRAGKLVIWGQGKSAELLPWISREYCGSVQSGTANMSRYLAFAASTCNGDGRHLFIFDREAQAPLVDTAFPDNARADLSPDGLHYATFEAGQLRIYSLPARL